METKIILQNDSKCEGKDVMILSPRIAPFGDRLEQLSKYTIVELHDDDSPRYSYACTSFAQFSKMCYLLKKRNVKFYAYIDKSIREYFNVDFV